MFADIITADDVASSKPDPACYRLTLERLRARHPERAIRADRSWAIEDSPVGIESAHGAGLKVLGLASTYPADQIRTADRVLASLTGLTPDRLAALTGS